MVKTVARPATAQNKVVKVQIKSDPETYARFGAACRILGGTIQATFNDLMRETIARAGLDSPSPRSSPRSSPNEK